MLEKQYRRMSKVLQKAAAGSAGSASASRGLHAGAVGGGGCEGGRGEMGAVRCSISLCSGFWAWPGGPSCGTKRGAVEWRFEDGSDDAFLAADDDRGSVRGAGRSGAGAGSGGAGGGVSAKAAGGGFGTARRGGGDARSAATAGGGAGDTRRADRGDRANHRCEHARRQPAWGVRDAGLHRGSWAPDGHRRSRHGTEAGAGAELGRDRGDGAGGGGEGQAGGVDSGRGLAAKQMESHAAAERGRTAAAGEPRRRLAA